MTKTNTAPAAYPLNIGGVSAELSFDSGDLS